MRAKKGNRANQCPFTMSRMAIDAGCFLWSAVQINQLPATNIVPRQISVRPIQRSRDTFRSESATPQMREAPGRGLRRGTDSSDRSDAGEIAR